MSNVLFLSVPSHGHVNPTIGLVNELVTRGETVTYFASPEFRDKIEKAGATFKPYAEDLDMFKAPQAGPLVEHVSQIPRIIQSGSAVMADILAQTQDQTFDYLIHSAAFLFAKPMTQLFKVPTVASLAVFAGLDFFFQEAQKSDEEFFPVSPELSVAYQRLSRELSDTYGVTTPRNIWDLFLNLGDLNLVYTSRYFAADLTYFDDTFKFVGPPVSDRKEQVDFPFEKLAGKQVLYISLGTVFGGHSPKLYDVFFNSFADWDGVVVMAAYNVDQSRFTIPDNFIVRNYVPQNEVLKYAAAAITHAGMNSISDLLTHQVPFVCLPLGADQPLLAARAQELGATIALDVDTLGREELRSAVERVMHDPSYLTNIKKISDSFEAAGGYPQAVEEIFKLKRERGIGD